MINPFSMFATGIENSYPTIDGGRKRVDEMAKCRPVIDLKQCTSVSGVYAAGDIVMSLDQISVAMGHAAIAATALHNDLRNGEGVAS